MYEGPFKGSITAFADDTAFSYSSTNVERLYSEMQSDISLLAIWFKYNKLTLNASKTFYINFGLANSYVFQKPLKYHRVGCLVDTCNCEILQQTSQTKYLGVIVDENMSWKPHIQDLIKYSRAVLSRFYTLKRLCPSRILKNIYFSLFQSKLQYGITCWGSTYITHIKPLISIQQSFIKYINGFLVRNKETLFQKFKILPIRNLYIYFVLKQFFWDSGNLGVIIDTNSADNRNTRGANRIKSFKPNSTNFQKSFIFLQSKFFNCLPSEFLSVRSLAVFKKKLKTHLISMPDSAIEDMYRILS